MLTEFAEDFSYPIQGNSWKTFVNSLKLMYEFLKPFISPFASVNMYELQYM